MYVHDARTMTQIARLKISQPVTHEGVFGLWDQLEAKGWDLKSRLYLGFDSQRILWTLIDDAGGVVDAKTKTTGKKKKSQ